MYFRAAILLSAVATLLVASCSVETDTPRDYSYRGEAYLKAKEFRSKQPSRKVQQMLARLEVWSRGYDPIRYSPQPDFREMSVAYADRIAVLPDETLHPVSFHHSRGPKEDAPEKKKFDRMMVRTTAYSHGEADHLRYGRLTARGTKLKFGRVRSAAADWSRFPVGTVFRILNEPGVIYEVDDYGSALVGTNTVDLYRPSMESMHHWGVRHVQIEVLRWGSFDESMHILEPRTHWAHVRKMANAIQRHRLPSNYVEAPRDQRRARLAALR